MGIYSGAVAIESLVGKITPILNDDILAEYRDVLGRPKFRFSKKAINIVLNGLIKRGLFTEGTPVEEVIPDPKDIVFYKVVMEVRKTNNAYLVTGNLKHFPVKPFVVTPREMMEIISTDET